ncbi:MAG: methionyl-tRNA formyltransferase [Deltaproteobacteria bacterium]|nr:methionyl-tRNA formyltransferase [Deltaproteobacteria bacterium]
MRIVFMGTPYFAAVVLRALVEGERAPVLVVSQPDRPKGRGRKLEPTPVHAEADTRGIPFIQPEKLTKDAVARIADAKPDVIVVSAYGKILRKNLLDLPPLGCLNTHASLLPKYRGAAPIAWAVIRGEERTGVTIMKLDEGVDTGPTLLSRAVPITPEDDAQTLTEKSRTSPARRFWRRSISSNPAAPNSSRKTTRTPRSRRCSQRKTGSSTGRTAPSISTASSAA